MDWHFFISISQHSLSECHQNYDNIFIIPDKRFIMYDWSPLAQNMT